MERQTRNMKITRNLIGFMNISIDTESVNIYVDNGEKNEPTHIAYWHIDEVEEDASVALSIANAINLFYTDKIKLLETLGYQI